MSDIKNIGQYAFYHCSLNTVTYKNKVYKYLNDLSKDLSNNNVIYYPEKNILFNELSNNNLNYSNNIFDLTYFSNDNQDSPLIFEMINNNVFTIDSNSLSNYNFTLTIDFINFLNNQFGLQLSDYKVVIISNRVINIMNDFFKDATNLEKLLFDNDISLNLINNYAFSNCQKLNKYYYEEKIYNNGIDLINYLLDSGITIGVNVFE